MYTPGGNEKSTSYKPEQRHKLETGRESVSRVIGPESVGGAGGKMKRETEEKTGQTGNKSDKAETKGKASRSFEFRQHDMVEVRLNLLDEKTLSKKPCWIFKDMLKSPKFY